MGACNQKRGELIDGVPLWTFCLRTREVGVKSTSRSMLMNDIDRQHLTRCVDLAETALNSDNDPFGSVLVSASGEVLYEEHNRTAGGDETRHPEFEIARWAAQNVTPAERATATVYTSGEHCAMCSAAHAWVGLGRIVYAGSTAQLVEWRKEFGAPPSPVKALAIEAVVNGIEVDGPEPSLSARLKELHRRRHKATKDRH
jgi:tRNA(Arg) A34 adenosine deaminase TadA